LIYTGAFYLTKDLISNIRGHTNQMKLKKSNLT